MLTKKIEVGAVLDKDMNPIDLQGGVGRYLLTEEGGNPVEIKVSENVTIFGDEREPVRLMVQELSHGFICTTETLPKMIVDPDGLCLTRKEVLAIAQACQKRLEQIDKARQEYEQLAGRYGLKEEVAA